MDPVTAAGGVNTVFSLFGYCIRGFTLFTEAQNIGKASDKLLCRLSIQELRLTQWGERAGLVSKGLLCPSLHRSNDAIMQTLGYLKSHLEAAGKVSDRYKFTLVEEQPKGMVGFDLGAITSRNSILDSPRINEIRRDILLRANLIKSANHWPKRLWWASMDSSKFERLVREIKTLVDDLWDLLSQRENQKLMHGR